MPETIEPATGTLPLPKAKRVRKSWTQAEVAGLVHGFASRKNYEGPRPGDEVEAKLLELGLIPKKEKPSLSAIEQGEIDDMLDYFRAVDGNHPTLAIRYALKHLQSLLPKRVAK
jgi:hypothetical protein